MKIHNYITASLSVLILPAQLIAAEEKTATVAKAASTLSSNTLNGDPMSGSYLVQLVVGLFIVLLCIVVLAWFAKKMKHFNPLADGSLKVIGGLSMGSRERVALLQVGEQQLLIGISPGRINTLHVLETPIEMAAKPDADSHTGNASGNNFLDKFKTVMADANSTANKQNK